MAGAAQRGAAAMVDALLDEWGRDRPRKRVQTFVRDDTSHVDENERRQRHTGTSKGALALGDDVLLLLLLFLLLSRQRV